MHIADPDSLTDTDWAMALAELKWVRGREAKRK